jgi:hypothetical protein
LGNLPYFSFGFPSHIFPSTYFMALSSFVLKILGACEPAWLQRMWKGFLAGQVSSTRVLTEQLPPYSHTVGGGIMPQLSIKQMAMSSGLFTTTSCEYIQNSSAIGATATASPASLTTTRRAIHVEHRRCEMHRPDRGFHEGARTVAVPAGGARSMVPAVAGTAMRFLGESAHDDPLCGSGVDRLQFLTRRRGGNAATTHPAAFHSEPLPDRSGNPAVPPAAAGSTADWPSPDGGVADDNRGRTPGRGDPGAAPRTPRSNPGIPGPASG